MDLPWHSLTNTIKDGNNALDVDSGEDRGAGACSEEADAGAHRDKDALRSLWML